MPQLFKDIIINPLENKKMTTFKTLEQVQRFAGAHQVTAQELINGCLYDKTGRWEDIQLSPDLKKQMCSDLSELYGGRKETKRKIFSSLMHETPQHWGLSRTVLETYSKKTRWTYITGQSQPDENKEIRKYLAH